MYLDWTIILLLPGIILGAIAQAKVKNAFRRYSSVMSSRGITARAAAEGIMNSRGCYNVPIELSSGGSLSDCYDPRNRVLRLSHDVYSSSSIAAIGVAAHEAGHACQHSDGYAFLNFRMSMAPVVSITSGAVFPIIMLGLFVNSQMLLNVAIAAYSLVVLFQLVTLPVEFNASKRALRALRADGYLTETELSGARKVLTAAALTYVAAAFSAMLQLLRLVLIFGGRRRR